jgi:hypothetical protein
VTPPLDPENQNGLDNNYTMNEELDLTAQQEMQTPSPVNEEFELMEQNNAIFNQINSQFGGHQDEEKPVTEEKPFVAEKMSTPQESQSPSENRTMEAINDEDGELDSDEKSSERPEKRSKKKRRHSGDEDDEKSGRKRRHSKSEEKLKLEKLKELKFGSAKSTTT